MQAVLLSPEITYSWEPTLCHERKATSRTPKGLASRSRRGLMGAGHVSRGSDGNSGDPVFSVLKEPVGEPADQNPGPSEAVLADGGSKIKQRKGGTGGRVNEPPGMGCRKSERFIVPMRPGNRTHRDPEEGRGRQGMEPMEGKMARTLDLGTVSTTLHRIAELASLSASGCATVYRPVANPCA